MSSPSNPGWPEALASARASGRVPARVEWLCSDANPDAVLREKWRARVLELAGMPSLPGRVASATAAAGRVIVAAARGERVRVPDEVYEERVAICRTCDQWDPTRHVCKICGCYTRIKLRLATEHCPLPEPKWTEWVQARVSGEAPRIGRRRVVIA